MENLEAQVRKAWCDPELASTVTPPKITFSRMHAEPPAHLPRMEASRLLPASPWHLDPGGGVYVKGVQLLRGSRRGGGVLVWFPDSRLGAGLCVLWSREGLGEEVRSKQEKQGEKFESKKWVDQIWSKIVAWSHL
jgi:hypothetical protein